MQQEDDLRALAKIMEFGRAVSIFILVVHVYVYCYPSMSAWHLNLDVIDRILMNFDRTTGIFGCILWTKLMAVLLLAISCMGTIGVKGEKITWQRIWAVLTAGAVNSRGVFESVMTMDYVFTPIVKDRMVMQSSLSFVSTVQDFIGEHPEAPLKEIRLFWNRMDSRTSKELYVMYNEIISRMGLKVFQTVLPDLERYNKEMTSSSRQHFRSTLLPPSDVLLKDSMLDVFAKEMERILFPV